MKEFTKTALNKVVRGPNRAIYDVEKINSILDASFLGYVSYIFNDQAISIPMAYGRMDNKLYLHGSLKNRMLLAALEAKQISITVMMLDGLILARSAFHHSVNYRSATLFGSTKKIEEKEEKTKILKCIVDHMIPGRWETLRPMSEKEFKATLVMEFEIETASAKIRDVGVNDEKSDHELPIWAGVVPIRQVAEFPESDDLLPKGVEIPQHALSYYHKNKW